MLVCSNKDVDKYKCTTCGKHLHSSASMKEHIKGVHGPKINKCMCGKAFSWSSALLRHKKNHVNSLKSKITRLL